LNKLYYYYRITLYSSAKDGTIGNGYKKECHRAYQDFLFIDKYYNKYSINSEEDGSPNS
jgi:hypothetical protein